MNDDAKSKKELISEIEELRYRLSMYEKDPGTLSEKQLEQDQGIFSENMEVVDYLKESRSFSHLPKKLIAELVPVSQIIEFPEKTAILKQGDPNDKIYFLIRGVVSIYSDGEFILGLKRTGDIFGEMSVISNKPCSATVLAETKVKVFSIDADVIGRYTDVRNGPLHSTLFRIFSMILTEKLSLTTFKAKQYEIEHKNLLSEIKHRKEVEHNLRIAQETSKIANKTKDEFMANMSHELRTPLNIISGFSELLAQMIKDPAQQEYLNSIRSASKQLLALIMDILDLSKIETGKLEIKTTRLDLKALFFEIEQIFKMKAVEKNIKIVQEFDKNFSNDIIFDKTRLRQVLFNLVGNAMKFTANGQITLSSDVSVHPDNKNIIDLEIKVRDTGIGIPKEGQQLIFDSFTQQDGKSTRKYGGTGLGLTICHRLTEMMNGEISLNSEVDVGSTFKLVFKDIETVGELDQNDDILFFDQNTISFMDAKILVVDDVILNRKLLEKSLSKRGCEILLAENGEEAIKMVQKHHPELIIMDIMMPVMDGIEATKKLKADRQTKHIPVIALTAFLEDQNISKILDAGFEACLSKPIDINDLLHELIKHLSYMV